MTLWEILSRALTGELPAMLDFQFELRASAASETDLIFGF